MAVWLCQCLCPDRHCILASAGEAEDEAEALREVRAPLRRQVLTMLGAGINPWCAMCGANRATWRYELRETAYATMADAVPHLTRIEMENLATNRVWGDTHRTDKPN